jgi:isovaleryl-CoA dehydrogenase
MFASKAKYYEICNMDEMRNELRLSAEKFTDEHIAPLADKIDKEDKMPRDLWPKMGSMGYLGMTVEEEFGGTGLGYYEHCLVTEEIAKGSASVALSYGAHSNLCVN